MKLKMKNTKNKSNDLELLINSHDEICISIIIPLAKLNPLREQNELIIDRAIQHIKEQAAQIYPSKPITLYLKKIKELTDQVDYVHPPEGLGVWVSDNIALLKKLPFAPLEITHIGTRFFIRELLALQALRRPFLALLLTEKEVKVYEGNNQELTELILPSIADLYKEKYEYAAPSRASSYAGSAHVKSFERDEELVSKERRKKIFNSLDRTIQTLNKPNTPLILIAESRLSNEFCKISSYPPSLLQCVEKDPSHLSNHEIEQICKDCTEMQRKKEHKRILEVLKESVGTGQARIGLQACWRAGQEGNCRVLLVEKNYSQPGFITPDPFYLFLTPPLTTHKILTDAVDELIEIVLKKNGSVLLIEPGLLSNENKIGLITRY
jgi:hypothetical protein